MEFRQRFNRVPQPFQRVFTTEEDEDGLSKERRRNLSGRRSDDGSTASTSSSLSDGIPIPVVHEFAKPNQTEKKQDQKKPIVKSNTAEINQPSSVEDREQRCASAPPTAEESGDHQSFVSSVNFTPNQPEQQHKPVVRNVPIFVEGRDNPLPRVDEEMRSRSNTPIRGSIRPRQQSPRAQSPGQIFTRPQRAEFKGSRLSREERPQEFQIPVQHELKAEKRMPPTFKTSVQQPDAETPKQFQRPVQHEPKADQRPPSREAAKASAHPPEPEKQAPLTEHERNLAKIKDVNKDLQSLISRIEAFKGKRSDKEFLYLDEMLTRLMIRLDDVTGEDVRAVRKETIKEIQKYISLLESKIEKGSSTKNEMDVEEGCEGGKCESSANNNECSAENIGTAERDDSKMKDEVNDDNMTGSDVIKMSNESLNDSANI
ncbi:BAG domain-containing protein Samui-like isoform X2 [Artemia franciscana]